MNHASIVVCSRYPDIFAGFKSNVDELAPKTWKILIRSGEAIVAPGGPYWITRQGRDPFIFARNVNIGIKAAGNDDIILVGDDVRFLTPNFVEILAGVAYANTDAAVVVPKIKEPCGASIFICCYIKRSVIDNVGLLDERFDGYGYEDNDFYTRYEAMHYHTHTAEDVMVSHPTSGTSFFRRQDTEGAPGVMESCARMKELYEEKWKCKK